MEGQQRECDQGQRAGLGDHVVTDVRQRLDRGVADEGRGVEPTGHEFVPHVIAVAIGDAGQAYSAVDLVPVTVGRAGAATEFDRDEGGAGIEFRLVGRQSGRAGVLSAAIDVDLLVARRADRRNCSRGCRFPARAPFRG